MAESTVAKKLRILPGNRVLVLHGPEGHRDALGSLPEGVSLSDSPDGQFDVVLAFHAKMAQLDPEVETLGSAAGDKGILWIAYPKGTAKVETDLNRDVLREFLGQRGLQAVALIAIDAIWSAMRLTKV